MVDLWERLVKIRDHHHAERKLIDHNTGSKDEAEKLFDEIKKNHPNAISHNGMLLVNLIK